MCCTVHPDTDYEGRYDKDIPLEILGKDDPLILRERDFHKKFRNSGSRKITDNNVFCIENAKIKKLRISPTAKINLK